MAADGLAGAGAGCVADGPADWAEALMGGKSPDERPNITMMPTALETHPRTKGFSQSVGRSRPATMVGRLAAAIMWDMATLVIRT